MGYLPASWWGEVIASWWGTVPFMSSNSSQSCWGYPGKKKRTLPAKTPEKLPKPKRKTIVFQPSHFLIANCETWRMYRASADIVMFHAFQLHHIFLESNRSGSSCSIERPLLACYKYMPYPQSSSNSSNSFVDASPATYRGQLTSSSSSSSSSSSHKLIYAFLPIIIITGVWTMMNGWCVTGHICHVFFERPAEIGTPKQTDRLFEDYCMVRCVKDTLSWLVVSTHLKNITQIGNLPQVSGWQ